MTKDSLGCSEFRNILSVMAIAQDVVFINDKKPV